ncbi:toxin-antitoxin system, antitoxin component, HicB family [Leptospira interrogans serovar Grippotyphosa str. LT2186]|uniref:Toxin-antitoxin system, antitoxin component, HicB family n=7 Tax=Leptospira interrogans TaxID=173 RepID=M3GMZ5_LEPIR|nr:hypothetical protein G436_4239 [Leptospira interrogans serovar Hardjo str. Norma]EJP02097.1 toxin-antitoxin system, antitoxin component, HicB family [Leptospira interrogans serovar Bulgarica str. Mallika]EKO07192.1 toxin-antitoxin system, antitoxin component, HicB family [Leptospira interrogans str. C10069]EKO23187.1 toxin-antitoxin system, antitoxin component, HicB family [Leptospira interrogans str. UI 12621]EKO96241.1 toxin-antitoxin system, antitoxin component, HicB family [Leptospira in
MARRENVSGPVFRGEYCKPRRIEALSNLQEALELHFENPVATLLPEIKKILTEVSVT